MTGPPPVAVVTGASRGLGAGLADAFAAHGIRLGLCARTLPDVPEGVDAVTAAVDVSEAAAVDFFAAEVVDCFGRVDLWVNNAGVLDPIGPLAEADPDAVRRLLEINVLGVMHGSATFARHVRSRPGGGVLVNMSSGAAASPHIGWAAYGASKAAVDMATDVVALEERRHGLRAFALSPGVVDTDMQALIRSTPPERFPSVERFHRLHESGAFNTPAWVASFILDHLVDGGAAASDGVRVRVPDQP
jgi:NAD(P)-dependent dehydrogenase (short-subunit alcohol dehydrogenase family)